jgi:predicted nucleic acid-binding protein
VPRRRLLLDACVAINLAATDKLRDIAQALSITFVITVQAEAEAGFLRDLSDGEVVLTAINLRSLAQHEVLEIVELEPSELVLYLDLATLVDDGEAATIAVAICRGLEIATDDRKARRICAERNQGEPVRTTALLRSYAQAVDLGTHQVSELLVKVRDRASFVPPRADPHVSWWEGHMKTSD